MKEVRHDTLTSGGMPGSCAKPSLPCHLPGTLRVKSVSIFPESLPEDRCPADPGEPPVYVASLP